MICKICDGYQSRIFNSLVLCKYNIEYYQCDSCGFVQTEFPFWLSEAYSSAISDLDIGYVHRNLSLSKKTLDIINNNFNPDGSFLDYAGGYGLFVRLMRDRGFNFYWQDDYCENLFAQHFEFDLTEIIEDKFELITGFEVIEHSFEPYQIINKVLNYSDSFLFSTELQPKNPSNINSWWYIVEETGQHISFFTLKSLNCIAEKCSCRLYSNNKNLHLLTRKNIKRNPFALNPRKIFKEKERKSLLTEDFSYVKHLKKSK